MVRPDQDRTKLVVISVAGTQDLAERQAAAAGTDAGMFCCNVESGESLESLKTWLVDCHDWTEPEMQKAWPAWLHEVMIAILKRNREGLGELPPCPCCGEPNALGVNSCMVEPGGARCCPWIICGSCGYSGPSGGKGGLAEAVVRWRSGELDLVSWLIKYGHVPRDLAMMILVGCLSGSSDFFSLLPRALRQDFVKTLIADLPRKVASLRKMAGLDEPADGQDSRRPS